MKLKRLAIKLAIPIVAITTGFASTHVNAACLTQAQAQAAINAKFNANSWLGTTVGSLQTVSGGWTQQYSVQNGSIWISACDNTGAHIVQGLIHADYSKVGLAALGFPVTDETADANSNRVSWFQNGSSWYQWGNSTAFSVQGFIQNKWLALAGFQGVLGYPISDEQPYSSNYFSGRISHFQNGDIVYKSGGTWQHGTYPIMHVYKETSNIMFSTTSSSQTGGVVTVYGFGLKPSTTVTLWEDTWYGSFQVDSRTSDANGFVQFPARGFDNNDAGWCTSSQCIMTLEITDGTTFFAGGAYLQP